MVKDKASGTEIDRMNVWIVWCDVQKTKKSGPEIFRGLTRPPGGVDVGGTYVRVFWEFAATIYPPEIITENEKPDFSGSPLIPVPNFDKAHFLDGLGLGQPKNKWDITRQARVRILSPVLGIGDLADDGPGVVYDALPNANRIVATSVTQGTDSYPSEELEGNDGSKPAFKSTDPYGQGNGRLEDSDEVRTAGVVNAAGAVGTCFEARWQFREFVRLEIGGRWYRVSDWALWRFHAKLKKDESGLYVDDGSVSDGTNDGWSD